MRRPLLLLTLLLAIPACHKRLEFPLVQKYQVTPGDLFYFRADGQFVLLERRKALDIAISPVGWQVYSYPDHQLTISRPVEPKPGEFHGSRTAEPVWENVPLMQTPSPMNRIAFSPTGGRLAGGADTGMLMVWDLTTGAPPTQLQDVAEVQALAFSPDGKTLAVGVGTHVVGTTLAINPGRVRLWDYASGRVIENFGAPAVNALAYAGDGRLAAGMADGTVLIRPEARGAPAAIQASTVAVTSVAWHPAGQAIVSAHEDKIIRIWNAETHELIGTLLSDIPLNPLFPHGIERVAFNATGTQLAAAYADGEIRIWNTTALLPQPK